MVTVLLIALPLVGAILFSCGILFDRKVLNAGVSKRLEDIHSAHKLCEADLNRQLADVTNELIDVRTEFATKIDEVVKETNDNFTKLVGTPADIGVVPMGEQE